MYVTDNSLVILILAIYVGNLNYNFMIHETIIDVGGVMRENGDRDRNIEKDRDQK